MEIPRSQRGKYENKIDESKEAGKLLLAAREAKQSSIDVFIRASDIRKIALSNKQELTGHDGSLDEETRETFDALIDELDEVDRLVAAAEKDIADATKRLEIVLKEIEDEEPGEEGFAHAEYRLQEAKAGELLASAKENIKLANTSRRIAEGIFAPIDRMMVDAAKKDLVAHGGMQGLDVPMQKFARYAAAAAELQEGERKAKNLFMGIGKIGGPAMTEAEYIDRLHQGIKKEGEKKTSINLKARLNKPSRPNAEGS